MKKPWNGKIEKRAAAVFLTAGMILWGPGGTSAAFCGEIAWQGQEAVETDSPAVLTLMAQSAVLMDGDTGRVLYGKNEDEVRPMASTTKIMTCILALENASLDDVVEVSDYAASMPDVQLNIRKGETYYLKDLLHSLMLESHNDSAVAIAEHVAGSREAFAEMMNQKARDLGCVDTTFLTPNGLDAKDSESGAVHSTTAKELAMILRYCISLSPRREEFLAITRTPSYTFSDIGGNRSFSCINHNALLTSMEGAVSGKTGFTNGAGYCYVGEVKKGDKTFIAALLGCGWPPHKNYKWQDMQKLIGFGNKNFEFREIRPAEVDFAPVPVEDGVGTAFGAQAETGLYLGEGGMETITVLMGKEEPVTIKKKTPKALLAPVEEDIVVGQVDYYVGDDLVASYPVKTRGAVAAWSLSYCARQVAGRFFVGGEV